MHGKQAFHNARGGVSRPSCPPWALHKNGTSLTGHTDATERWPWGPEVFRGLCSVLPSELPTTTWMFQTDNISGY